MKWAQRTSIGNLLKDRIIRISKKAQNFKCKYLLEIVLDVRIFIFDVRGFTTLNNKHAQHRSLYNIGDRFRFYKHYSSFGSLIDNVPSIILKFLIKINKNISLKSTQVYRYMGTIYPKKNNQQP